MPYFTVINVFNGQKWTDFSSFGAAESAVERLCFHVGDDADYEIRSDDGRVWAWVSAGDDSGFTEVTKEPTNGA
jgi:hypothetical protein